MPATCSPTWVRWACRCSWRGWPNGQARPRRRRGRVASVMFAVISLGGAWTLMTDSVDVLLESAPGHIPLSDVAREIASVPGVQSVHDLHVWTLTSGVIAMSGHAIVVDPAVNQQVL